MLAVMPERLKPPYKPMEAVSVASIPEGDNWQYEPKWDGFRCLAFKHGDIVELQSKSEKMLTTYFPEVVRTMRALHAATLVLDGELVIPVDGKLSFDHLLMRLSRTGGGAKRQAGEYPAVFFVFDLLADADGEVLTGQPLSVRRSKLEDFADNNLDGDKGTIRLSPATRDIEVARRWLDLAGTSLDGVVAKRTDVPYQPGTTRYMQKIKTLRTVDCVVGGVILKGGAVSHILLGLYDGDLLNFVGSAPLRQMDGKKLASEIGKLIEEPGFTGKKPGEVRTQFGHRMGEWQPLNPKLVAEVQYDHFTGGRFRHGAKFLRWRPDKKPQQCTLSQVAR